MQVTPNKRVGYVSRSMVVVICPTCGNKRWANIMTKDGHSNQVRTTCCGTVVDRQIPREDINRDQE